METLFPIIAAVILLLALDRGESAARSSRRSLADRSASADWVSHAR